MISESVNFFFFFCPLRFARKCEQTCRARAATSPSEVTGIRGGSPTQCGRSGEQPHTGGQGSQKSL